MPNEPDNPGAGAINLPDAGILRAWAQHNVMHPFPSAQTKHDLGSMADMTIAHKSVTGSRIIDDVSGSLTSSTTLSKTPLAIFRLVVAEWLLPHPLCAFVLIHLIYFFGLDLVLCVCGLSFCSLYLAISLFD